MPDTRVVHSHVAHSVYGAHGPRNDMPGGSPRPMTTTMRFAKAPPEPPQSISEHISSAVEKIPGLTGRQKNAVHAAMLAMTRDISFVKMVHDQVGWAPRALLPGP